MMTFSVMVLFAHAHLRSGEESASGVHLLQKEAPAQSIAVVITTKDRIGYVQLCAMALEGTIPARDIWIYDDGSTEYTSVDLKSWFGEGTNLFTLPGSKESHSWHQALDHVLSTGRYDVALSLDSDMVVEPSWAQRVSNVLAAKPRFFLSAYHSAEHRTNSCDGDLCTMKDMGSAGSLWTKEFADEVRNGINHHELQGESDWDVVAFCQKQNIEMKTMKNSAVAHVGMYGSNGDASRREKALGFPAEKLAPKVRELYQRFLNGAAPEKLAFRSSVGTFVLAPKSQHFVKAKAGASVELVDGPGHIAAKRAPSVSVSVSVSH